MSTRIKKILFNIADRVILFVFGLVVAVFGAVAPKTCLQRLRNLRKF